MASRGGLERLKASQHLPLDEFLTVIAGCSMPDIRRWAVGQGHRPQLCHCSRAKFIEQLTQQLRAAGHPRDGTQMGGPDPKAEPQQQESEPEPKATPRPEEPEPVQVDEPEVDLDSDSESEPEPSESSISSSSDSTNSEDDESSCASYSDSESDSDHEPVVKRKAADRVMPKSRKQAAPKARYVSSPSTSPEPVRKPKVRQAKASKQSRASSPSPSPEPVVVKPKPARAALKKQTLVDQDGEADADSYVPSHDQPAPDQEMKILLGEAMVGNDGAWVRRRVAAVRSRFASYLDGQVKAGSVSAAQARDVRELCCL